MPVTLRVHTQACKLTLTHYEKDMPFHVCSETTGTKQNQRVRMLLIIPDTKHRHKRKGEQCLQASSKKWKNII